MENKQLKSFRDLVVWQKSSDLAVLIYSITEKFPRSELYGLTNQMRRSAVSISSNIAEGFKRSHNKEKLQFYNIAYGSVAELESQIEIAFKLNFLSNEEYQTLSALTVEVGKMLDGLIKSVNKSPKSHLLNSIFFFVFLYSIFYILNPASIQAAQLKLDSQASEIGIGQQFQIDLLLNTAGEEINAIEGKIMFPADILELKEIKDGNSIINFWIERPSLNSKSYIPYSGVTPGGFNGEKGLILSAVFEVKKEGIAVFGVNDARVLRNDGLGSQAALAIESFKIVVSGGDFTEISVFTTLADKGQPESFLPKIARDEALFGGKWFVAFATQDKDSGIGHYEIKESRQKIFGAFEKWIPAESPYVLQDQELRSFIWIKAIDKANNERIIAVDPENPLRWYEYPFIWIIIILTIFFAYFARNKIWKKPFIHL